LCKDKKCGFKKKLKDKRYNEPDLTKPRDIEDLSAWGMQQGICPYFFSKQVQP